MLVTSISFLLASYAFCSPLEPNSSETLPNYLAPLHNTNLAHKYPDEYLVELQDGYTLQQHFQTIGRDLSNTTRFERYGFGYRATLDDTTRDALVRRDPGVIVVEANAPIQLEEPIDWADLEDAELPEDTDILQKQGRSYGLQMLKTANGRLDVPVKDKGIYDYICLAGRGAQVYVFDSRIRTTHKQFMRRARHFGGLADTDISPYIDEIMQRRH